MADSNGDSTDTGHQHRMAGYLSWLLQLIRNLVRERNALRTVLERTRNENLQLLQQFHQIATHMAYSQEDRDYDRSDSGSEGI